MVIFRHLTLPVMTAVGTRSILYEDHETEKYDPEYIKPHFFLDCGTNATSRDHEVTDGVTSHSYLL